MDPSTNGRHELAAKPMIRFHAHKRIARSVSLNPDVHAWIEREAALHRCSFSEAMNRLLVAQLDLREQLSALPETDTNGQTPLFAVLLERHGEKVSKTVDQAVGGLARIEDRTALLEEMVKRFAEAAMPPPRFKQWELDIQKARGKR